MSALHLFTVFHANLDFSALPDRDVPVVISRCYWPLLGLAERARLPLGIEMPARTLRRLAGEDPEWVKYFRQLIERGLVEPVASGWSQLIGPLVPADVHEANLELGRDAYAEILGAVPETWFVNEQTFSRGIAPAYREVGARALVMEWNNPASRRSELRPLRCRPVHLETAQDEGLTLLWNDSIVFQKVQRACHGIVPADELIEAVARLYDQDEERALCVYGGDLEIFDYRPGHAAPEGAAHGTEMRRLAQCLRALAADERFRFTLPREVASRFSVRPCVELATPGDPIPCKKQPRYNPTRWAVSGRDGFGMNTRCHALRRDLRVRAFLEGRSGPELTRSERSALATLWASDYRTRATEERVEDFQRRMGTASAHARDGLESLVPELGEREDVVLVNASDEPWCGEPVEVPLQLPPGRFGSEDVRVASATQALAAEGSQVEVESRHRDGSIRRATLVLEPHLEAGQRLGFSLEPAPQAHGPEGEVAGVLATESVELSLLEHRGCAIGSLAFPAIEARPVVGTLPHGSFDDIAYTPDFYSGHAVAIDETARKHSDLGPATSLTLLPATGNVRTTLCLRTRTALGMWSKRFRVYRHQPRLDWVHDIEFHEARLQSLRLGLVTLLPDAFERDELYYACVNGGRKVERFPLQAGMKVDQQRAVSAAVSASSCLGATEGWISVGDDQRGVAVVTDRARAAVVPMMEFADVDDRFFLRIHHTAAESDETRATFFRGHRRFAFALLGHRNDLEAVRRSARATQRGLVYRTERAVGIAGNL